MSDTDRDDSPARVNLDLESSCPRHSLVDSTIDITPLNYRVDEEDYESSHHDQ